MQPESSDTPYTIADLARLTGVNVRTIRYYLAQGLLPASGESGPGAHYGEGHLGRLRLTKRLQEQHLPLAEIRRRLAELSDAQVAELLASSVVEERESRQSSALEYVRNLLGQAAGGPSVGETPIAFALPAASLPSPATMARRARSMPVAAFLPGQARPEPDAGEEAPPMSGAGMPRMRDEPAMRPTDAAPAPTAAPEAASEPAVALPRKANLIEPQLHERSQWERLSLGPNVEIHIRRPLSRIEQRRVERLITIARQVLKEDKP